MSITSAATSADIGPDVAAVLPRDLFERLSGVHLMPSSGKTDAPVIPAGVPPQRVQLAHRASIVSLAELLLTYGLRLSGERRPADARGLVHEREQLEALVKDRMAMCSAGLPQCCVDQLEPMITMLVEILPATRSVRLSGRLETRARAFAEDAEALMTGIDADPGPTGVRIGNAVAATASFLALHLIVSSDPSRTRDLDEREQSLVLAAAGGCMLPSARHRALRRMVRDRVRAIQAVA